MTSIERFNRAEARTFRLYRLLRATVALALTGLLFAAISASAAGPTTEPPPWRMRRCPPASRVLFKDPRSVRRERSSTC